MIQSAVARKNGREPEGLVSKGRDDFFLIFLFTFLIKQKSKCLSGMRTIKIRYRFNLTRLCQ
jgi:hypothetical protein